ncbi:CheR family methyltransferase [Methylobacter tundripaludum]|uniref:CheR family methyltransferase n=1 Tax=Methylobacter tundripaludum TaxID=173365 RepID=UPI0021572511|nr:protein-glutamate O-methyltransferase CheR [Methylobacter tundripaludum]
MSAEEFSHFRRVIYDHAGIALTPEKKIMVASRLAKRLLHYGLQTYGQYYQLLNTGQHPQEFQLMVNILTTNETYFFREPKHFDFLQEQIVKTWRGDNFRLWSAASSTGEESYSIGMTLAETLGMRKWEVFGSDLNTEVLDTARQGVYLMDRLDNMDKRFLDKYCLKGVRSQEGYFRVDEKIRKRVSFGQINLKTPLPKSLGQFDVIFLRNVLIYFDTETKQDIVQRVISALKPGGYFFISHSETLHNIKTGLSVVAPSIYQKPCK